MSVDRFNRESSRLSTSHKLPEVDRLITLPESEDTFFADTLPSHYRSMRSILNLHRCERVIFQFYNNKFLFFAVTILYQTFLFIILCL